jgi:hypothetical protein
MPQLINERDMLSACLGVPSICRELHMRFNHPKCVFSTVFSTIYLFIYLTSNSYIKVLKENARLKIEKLEK